MANARLQIPAIAKMRARRPNMEFMYRMLRDTALLKGTTVAAHLQRGPMAGDGAAVMFRAMVADGFEVEYERDEEDGAPIGFIVTWANAIAGRALDMRRIAEQLRPIDALHNSVIIAMRQEWMCEGYRFGIATEVGATITDPQCPIDVNSPEFAEVLAEFRAAGYTCAPEDGYLHVSWGKPKTDPTDNPVLAVAIHGIRPIPKDSVLEDMIKDGTVRDGDVLIARPPEFN